MRDKIMELIGRANGRVIAWEGMAGALKLVECLWLSAGPEARQQAQRLPMWSKAMEKVRRAMDWA